VYYVRYQAYITIYPRILQDFVERIVMQPWERWYSHHLYFVFITGLVRGQFRLPLWCILMVALKSTRDPSSQFTWLFASYRQWYQAKLVRGGCWACCPACWTVGAGHDAQPVESLRTLPTKPAQMIQHTALFSSVPLKRLICLSKGLWRTLEWPSCMNRPPLPVSTWLLQPTWRAGSPLSPFFWLETRLQGSLPCSASARIQASRMAVRTQQLPTEGGAACLRG
jgi:hypothetical protein